MDGIIPVSQLPLIFIYFVAEAPPSYEQPAEAAQEIQQTLVLWSSSSVIEGGL